MFFLTPKCKYTNIFKAPEAPQEVPSQKKICVTVPIKTENPPIKSVHSTNTA